MRIQLTWTLITELSVMAASILLLKLAAQLLGPVGFGEYTLSRRAVGLLYLPLVMGFGIAAPRYVAISRAGALPGYNARLFAVATLTAGLLPTLIVILLLNLSAGTELTVEAVENRYFGGDVSVAGLLTGGDLVAARERLQGDFVIIPRSTLKSDEQIMLDGMTLQEVSRKFDLPVHAFDLKSFAQFLSA